MEKIRWVNFNELNTPDWVLMIALILLELINLIVLFVYC